LGELIKNERTFVMPGGSETYTFEMRWAYDSWNRVLNITYPDSEVVHYDYDAGGQLKSMYGM
jgi:YD repeat-containing protein